MCNALLNAMDRFTVNSIICQIPPHNSIFEKTKMVTFVHFHWGNAILPFKALIHPHILFSFFNSFHEFGANVHNYSTQLRAFQRLFMSSIQVHSNAFTDNNSICTQRKRAWEKDKQQGRVEMVKFKIIKCLV